VRVHHLDRVISELQYVSMGLRMMPIASTFRKLIVLVHDLSYKSSKSVKLVTEGEETEVDKTVVDLIADPAGAHRAQRHRPRHRAPGGPENSRKPETGIVTIGPSMRAGKYGSRSAMTGGGSTGRRF